tara:strand:- start:275 stop:808 length:534 start_codon:yes stop_codon:yes gene_type:complete
MFIFKMKFLSACVLITLFYVKAGAAEGPDLGQPISAEELAKWDISIAPDGGGLPPGSGTAVLGAPIFQAKCLACHGPEGQNGLHDQLVGGIGSLATEQAVKTVGSYWPYATTLFDFIRRAMPYQQPHTLSDPEAYSLTAYLLYLNGIIEETELIDQNSLPKVIMPNRDNFIWTEDAR